MHLLEVVSEEIALEGLDDEICRRACTNFNDRTFYLRHYLVLRHFGITLSMLWVRLLERKNFDVQLDEETKNYIWRYIRLNPHVDFYVLPSPRPDFSSDGAKKTGAKDQKTPYSYPVHVVTSKEGKDVGIQGSVWGSCEEFSTRKNISDHLKSSAAYDSLKAAVSHYADSLVLVANQDLRVRTLVGPLFDPGTFLDSYLNSNQHYAVLERIGRSRHNGEASMSPNPLFKAFNLRPKDVAYILKLLQNLKVIKRQFSIVDAGKKGVYSSISTLVRYSKLTENGAMHQKIRQMVSILSKFPDRTAPCSTFRKLFPLTNFKRAVLAFPDVVKSFQKSVENPMHSGRSSKGLKNDENSQVDITADLSQILPTAESVQMSDNENVDTTAAPSSGDELTFDAELNARASVKYRSTQIKAKPRPFALTWFYQLAPNVQVLSDEGDWRVANNDGCDSGDETRESGQVYELEFMQKSHLRSLTNQVLTLVRVSGEHGLTARDINRQLCVDYKDLCRLLDHLKVAKVVNCLMLNEGKVRRYLYLWPGVEHKSNADFELFQSLSGVSFTHLLNERGKLMVGTNSVKRLNAMLTMIRDRKVMQMSELVRFIRTQEKIEDKQHVVDAKCVANGIDLLKSLGAIKIYCVELIEYSKRLKFVCDRSVRIPDDPLLICHVESTLHSLNRQNLGDEENSMDVEFNERTKIRDKPLTKKRKLRESTENGRKKVKMEGWNQTDTSEKSGPSKKYTMEDALKIMTYRIGAMSYYGMQGKCVRFQLIHEYLCYWIFYHKGRLVPKPKISPKNCAGQPPVYQDDETWRRYIPPVPKHIKCGLPLHWFSLHDMIECMPVSIALMIFGSTYTIDGLAEILADPLKRHYPLKYLPELIRLALKSRRKFCFNLARLCYSLCVMGLLSRGCSIKLSVYSSLEDSTYFLHSSCRLIDTSASGPTFRVAVQPMSKYKIYEYSFDQTFDQVELFWLHMKAVCHSSRFGRNLCKWPADQLFIKQFSDSHKSLSNAIKIELKSFDSVTPAGTPCEPTTGAAGFHPILFLFKEPNWRLNLSEFASWFLNEMRHRCVKYWPLVRQRVHSLQPSWNSFAQGWSSNKSLASHNIFMTPRQHLPSSIAPRKASSVVSKKSKSKADLEKLNEQMVRTSLKRSIYKERHRRVMLMVRAIALLIQPSGKFWVDKLVGQELLHKYFPDFRNQPIHRLLIASVRDTYTNNESYDELLKMTKQLKLNKEIREMLQTFKMKHCYTIEDKTDLYKRIFEKAVYIFTTGSNLLAQGRPLESLLENFTFATPPEQTVESDVKNVEQIKESVIFNVYVSSLALSRRDGTMTAQCVEIFKNFPMRTMCNVLNRMKHDMLITPRRCRKLAPSGVFGAVDDDEPPAAESSGLTSTMPPGAAGCDADVALTSASFNETIEADAEKITSTSCIDTENALPRMCGSRRELYLTYHYRHFFFHKFHLNFTEQALNFYDFIVSQSEHFCSALDEVPGYVPVIVALMALKQVDLSVRLPDVLISVGDKFLETLAAGRPSRNDGDRQSGSESAASSAANSSDADVDASDKRLALAEAAAAVGAKGGNILQHMRIDRLQREERLNLQRRGRRCWSQRVSIRSHDLGLVAADVSVKCRASAAAQQLACISAVRTANRRLMRHEILPADVEGPPAVQQSTFASPEVTAASVVKGSCRKFARPSRRAASSKKNPPPPPELTEGATSLDAFCGCTIEKKFRLALNKAGPLGLTLESLKLTVECWDFNAELILQNLLDKKQIFRCGTVEFRYVSACHCDPWFVNSFKLPKDFRSVNENLEEYEDKKIPVKFMPRAWLRPDGSLNRPMLRWLCEGVFLRIFALPGITHKDLYKQFDLVLHRTSLDELLEYMEIIGCIEKCRLAITTSVPTLFGSKNETTQILESFRTPVDAVPKFATIFSKTPMPDFVLTEDQLGMSMRLKTKFNR